ncbi:MAG: hypothetical protein V1736_07210 [Pseudomonadota bacterium]
MKPHGKMKEKNATVWPLKRIVRDQAVRPSIHKHCLTARIGGTIEVIVRRYPFTVDRKNLKSVFLAKRHQ